LDCPAGTFADHVGQASCTPCQVGHYGPYAGAKTCNMICPTGTSTNDQLGQAACTACAKGKYADSAGLAHCIDCPLGYHQSATGQIGCVACPVGTSSNGTTASVDCLACSPGTYANFVGTPSCYEQERKVPDNKDITATISVMVAMFVLVSLLGFTYYYRDTIFGAHSETTEEEEKNIAVVNRA